MRVWQKQGPSFVLRVSAGHVKEVSVLKKKRSWKPKSKFCSWAHCDTLQICKGSPRSISTQCLTQWSYWIKKKKCATKYHNFCPNLSQFWLANNQPIHLPLNSLYIGSKSVSVLVGQTILHQFHPLSVYWLHLWMHRVQTFKDSTTITDFEMGGRSSVNQIYSNRNKK